MRIDHSRLPGALLALAFIASACIPAAAAGQLSTPTPTATIHPTAALTIPTAEIAVPIPEPLVESTGRLWVGPHLPMTLTDQISLPQGWQFVASRAASTAEVEILPANSNTLPYTYWLYALVTPFPSRSMEAASADLLETWRKDHPGQPIWLSEETAAVFTAFWGEPGEDSLRIVPAEDLLDLTWSEQAYWALVPFEQVEPRWRVLRVDGLSPFDPEFDSSTYPLSVPISWTGETEPPTALLPPSNYQRDQLTVLAMTGVTALSRRTAALMNAKGIRYPARDVGDWLAAADLTHISNEVSFNAACPPTRAALFEALFCSPPEYIRLLERVGTDIVELTGNHNLDRGADAYWETLDMYAERGWLTYGGGQNLETARQPLLIEHNGNRLAFLGCNVAGPDVAWATETTPGAAPCDFPALQAQVTELRQAGYLPVVTLQAFETEDYMPAPMQQPSEFVRLAEAGALVVSGSQSHVPQGFRFAGDGLVHFGLGNLFFDQTDSTLSRRAFIDRHVFYQGRYLGVELYPVSLLEYGRPEPMDEHDRAEFIDTIFKASGWLP